MAKKKLDFEKLLPLLVQYVMSKDEAEKKELARQLKEIVKNG